MCSFSELLEFTVVCCNAIEPNLSAHLSLIDGLIFQPWSEYNTSSPQVLPDPNESFSTTYKDEGQSSSNGRVQEREVSQSSGVHLLCSPLLALLALLPLLGH